MQQKNVFKEYCYFSHPRLKAPTASGFLQRERGRCCCTQGWLRDHSWQTPPHLQLPLVLSRSSSQPQCPANLWQWLCLQRTDVHVTTDTVKDKALPGKAAQAPVAAAEKPENFFPKDPNWKCFSQGQFSHRNALQGNEEDFFKINLSLTVSFDKNFFMIKLRLLEFPEYSTISYCPDFQEEMKDWASRRFN